MIDLLFVGLFQVVSGSAQAAPPAEAPTEQTAPAAQEDRDVQCTSAARTGSLMHHRTCTTRQQRHEADIERQQTHDRVAREVLTASGMAAAAENLHLPPR